METNKGVAIKNLLLLSDVDCMSISQVLPKIYTPQLFLSILEDLNITCNEEVLGTTKIYNFVKAKITGNHILVDSKDYDGLRAEDVEKKYCASKTQEELNALGISLVANDNVKEKQKGFWSGIKAALHW